MFTMLRGLVSYYYLNAPLRLGGWEGSEHKDICASLTSLPSSHWIEDIHRIECEIRIARAVDSWTTALLFAGLTLLVTSTLWNFPKFIHQILVFWYTFINKQMFGPRIDTSLLLAEAIEQLPRRIALALAELESDCGSNVSVLSDPQYEEDARNWLPSQLLQRCGLVVVENFNAQRTYLMELQWDFRAPVIIAQTESNPNLELNVFEIFPTGTPYYLRPKAIKPRYITPTKSIGSDNPPTAQYFALFEFTTASGWSKRSRRKGDGAFKTMAARLNERLAKTLDRAKEEKLIAGDARITDLVSVIGVVAPTSCNESMSMMMNKKDNVPLLLKEMMDAKRFVVFIKPNVAHQSRSSNKSSPSPDSIFD